MPQTSHHSSQPRQPTHRAHLPARPLRLAGLCRGPLPRLLPLRLRHTLLEERPYECPHAHRCPAGRRLRHHGADDHPRHRGRHPLRPPPSGDGLRGPRRAHAQDFHRHHDPNPRDARGRIPRLLLSSHDHQRRDLHRLVGTETLRHAHHHSLRAARRSYRRGPSSPSRYYRKPHHKG